jgi:ribonuclease P protein component
MPRDIRTEGLSRRHRFTAQGSFGAVLRSPRKFRGQQATLHVVAGRPGASRLGIALTRRLIARSVDRTRLKRLVRETFRRHVVKRAGLDCVISFRNRFDPADSRPLIEEIRALFDQLAKTDR